MRSGPGETGFYCRQVRPGRAVQRLFRPPSVAGSDGQVGRVLQEDTRGRRQQMRFAVRHAWTDDRGLGGASGAAAGKIRPAPVCRNGDAGAGPSDGSGGASILQMNLGGVGGILEAKKIAGIAEVHCAQIAPHLYNGPVGAAASVQLATATPNFLIQESIMTWQGFHAEILKKPIQWEDGFIIPSREPGLGVELNMDVVEANAPYVGSRLHITMDPHPFDVKQPSGDSWKQRWSDEVAR